jgi:hypothetical protein
MGVGRAEVSGEVPALGSGLEEREGFSLLRVEQSVFDLRKASQLR